MGLLAQILGDEQTGAVEGGLAVVVDRANHELGPIDVVDGAADLVGPDGQMLQGLPVVVGRHQVVEHHPVGDLARGAGVLIVRAGAQAGDRFTLDSDITRLGRHPESEISLDDITVSRRHAEVQRTAEGYVVADSGSLNGTYVNQERVERAMLRHGDEVQIGKFRLVFFERADG